MKREELLLRIVQSLPHPQQITELDFSTEDSAIRFLWRGERFRVTTTLSVETVEGGVLVGSNSAMLLEQLLKANIGEA